MLDSTPGLATWHETYRAHLFTGGGFVVAILAVCLLGCAAARYASAKARKQQDAALGELAASMRTLSLVFPERYAALRRGAAKPGGRNRGARGGPGGVTAPRGKPTVRARLAGCAEGVGLGLDSYNVVTEIRPGTAAARCAVLRVGDRIVAVDGESLEGRALREVIVAADHHDFELIQQWLPLGTMAEAEARRQQMGGGDGDPYTPLSDGHRSTDHPSSGDEPIGLRDEVARRMAAPVAKESKESKESKGTVAFPRLEQQKPSRGAQGLRTTRLDGACFCGEEQLAPYDRALAEAIGGGARPAAQQLATEASRSKGLRTTRLDGSCFNVEARATSCDDMDADDDSSVSGGPPGLQTHRVCGMDRVGLDRVIAAERRTVEEREERIRGASIAEVVDAHGRPAGRLETGAVRPRSPVVGEHWPTPPRGVVGRALDTVFNRCSARTPGRGRPSGSSCRVSDICRQSTGDSLVSADASSRSTAFNDRSTDQDDAESPPAFPVFASGYASGVVARLRGGSSAEERQRLSISCGDERSEGTPAGVRPGRQRSRGASGAAPPMSLSRRAAISIERSGPPSYFGDESSPCSRPIGMVDEEKSYRASAAQAKETEMTPASAPDGATLLFPERSTSTSSHPGRPSFTRRETSTWI